MKPKTRLSYALAGVFCFALGIGTAVASPQAEGRGKGERGKQRVDATGGNPSELAAKMIQNFDTNGDRQLQVTELGTAMAAIQQQRGARPGEANRGERSRSGMGQPQRGGAQGGPNRQRGPSQRGQQRAGNRQQRPGTDGGPMQRPRGGQAGQRQVAPEMGNRDAARGGDPSQRATQIIAEFDQNRNQALDLQELTAALQARQTGRNGQAGRGDRAGGQNRPNAAAGDNRQNRRPQANAQGSGKPGSGKPGSGKQRGNRGDRAESEPGTGVVPKRPGS
ncbi:MAG: hypothetical protein AAGD07_25075 [Planctomycetota bacterium]